MFNYVVDEQIQGSQRVRVSLDLPKIVCLSSSHWVGARVMKNCDPLVSGPELAMESMPAPEWQEHVFRIEFV
jgi:hypothetical protein